MEQARVYSINAQEIADHLNNNGIQTVNVVKKNQAIEAIEHGLVITIDESVKIDLSDPDALIPHGFMIEMHEKVSNLILNGAEPAFRRRPWRPGTIIGVDPRTQEEQEENFKSRFRRYIAWPFNGKIKLPSFRKKIGEPEPASPPDMIAEMFNRTIAIDELVRTVQTTLGRNLRIEKHYAGKGIDFIIGDRRSREKYVCSLVRQKEKPPDVEKIQ